MLRAIAEAIRQTVDQPRLILPATIAIDSAQTAEGGGAEPEPEGGTSVESIE